MVGQVYLLDEHRIDVGGLTLARLASRMEEHATHDAVGAFAVFVDLPRIR